MPTRAAPTGYYWDRRERWISCHPSYPAYDYYRY